MTSHGHSSKTESAFVTIPLNGAALRALGVRSSSQHSIEAGSKTAVSSSWSCMNTRTKNCSLFDETVPSNDIINILCFSTIEIYMLQNRI